MEDLRDCPDLDALLAVEAALGWSAENAIRHIATCEACLAEIRQVERIRAELDQSLEPSPDFVDRVLAAVPSAPDRVQARRAGPEPILSTGIFVLAFATALLVFGLASLAGPGASGIRPEVVLFAGLVGYVATRVTPRLI